MVLTPQLRQRIEMLQMTTLELSDLIQQEIESNPILEEVQTEEEFEEIASVDLIIVCLLSCAVTISTPFFNSNLSASFS